MLADIPIYKVNNSTVAISTDLGIDLSWLGNISMGTIIIVVAVLLVLIILVLLWRWRRLKITPASPTVPCDGKAPLPIRVMLVNGFGLKRRPRTNMDIEMEATAGSIQNVMLPISRDSVEAMLVPSKEFGPVTVTAKAGKKKARAAVNFVCGNDTGQQRRLLERENTDKGQERELCSPAPGPDYRINVYAGQYRGQRKDSGEVYGSLHRDNGRRKKRHSGYQGRRGPAHGRRPGELPGDCAAVLHALRGHDDHGSAQVPEVWPHAAERRGRKAMFDVWRRHSRNSQILRQVRRPAAGESRVASGAAA